MAIQDDARFLAMLRETFAVEAQEHVETLSAGVMALEKGPAARDAADVVDVIFRAAHSLKGAARAVHETVIESRCQSLETTFSAWKRLELVPTPETLDDVHRAIDAITTALAMTVPAAAPVADVPVDVPRLASPPSAERGAPETTVRIAAARLDAQLLKAEEVLAVKLAAGQRVEELYGLTRRFEIWRREWTAVEPAVHALGQRIDRLPAGADPSVARLLAFVDWNAAHLKSLDVQLSSLVKTADLDRQDTGRLIDDLLEGAKRLLLLPFATAAVSFPKLVRDLCRDQGKDADLTVQGDDVEVDKRILEEMKDPLIHLLRNAVDHGVERPDDRAQRGKSVRATIAIAVSRVNGSKIEIAVEDDGAGIDVEVVKASAVRQGRLAETDAARMGEDEARELVFTPDVTASPSVTRLSGRGLGLAIVREKAEKLGGTVSVESRAGLGTRFSIVLPSTLATFRGLVVEAARRLFVVPTFQIERVIRVRRDEIRKVEGRDAISFGDRAVSLVTLADALDLPPTEPRTGPDAALVAVVIGAAEQRTAFVVDAAIDEQEVLVKPLRKPLSRVRNIAGATVLGSGHVVPILNVSDLLKSARKARGVAVALPVAPVSPAGKSVLVAEDSITSRMLITGILEGAGFTVRAVVDGMEAFMRLREEAFDLLVSDIEMPRLNGFDLAARIRADPRIAGLPIILVTALETPADRERGVDVGANAYIVKSSFDQSNLLDAVRRLIG